MVTNYYNASNNFSAPIRKEPKPFAPERPPIVCTEEKEDVPVCYDEPSSPPKKGLSLLKTDSDTIVLGALLWLLFSSKSDDRLLEIALIYLLLS